MKFRPIIVDSALQELTEHGTEEFPMSMDEQIVEQCANTPHWHYEIQIVLMTRGGACFKTPAGDFALKQGEGIFINSGVMHEVAPVGSEGSVYICVNFHPRMIFGDSGSMIRRDYVDPLLFCPQMQAIPLTDEEWHRAVCALLQELGRVNVAQEYGYEIMLKVLLCRIWMILLQQHQQLVDGSAAVSFADRQRAKSLQNFIHKNYMEQISLKDIADAAHISRGECCRVFKRVQGTTPFLYLIRYRVTQSVKMLSTTDLSVSAIAQQVGFGSSSYFTECFKKEMRCTPMEYRKQLQRRPPADAGPRDIDGK